MKSLNPNSPYSTVLIQTMERHTLPLQLMAENLLRGNTWTIVEGWLWIESLQPGPTVVDSKTR